MTFAELRLGEKFTIANLDTNPMIKIRYTDKESNCVFLKGTYRNCTGLVPLTETVVQIEKE